MVKILKQPRHGTGSTLVRGPSGRLVPSGATVGVGHENPGGRQDGYDGPGDRYDAEKSGYDGPGKRETNTPNYDGPKQYDGPKGYDGPSPDSPDRNRSR